MTVKRLHVVLALSTAALVAACGGGSAGATPASSSAPPQRTDAVAASEPAASVEDPAASEAAPASVEAPAAGGPGTITVTVGGKTVSTRIACEGDASGLIVTPAADSSDTVVVLISAAGLTTASGTISGVDFAINPGGTSSTDGKSGTFSGTDGGTDLAISGSFTCP